MEKYQKAKVYAIICRKTGRRYIGSTCEPTLAKRLAKHVSSFKEWLKTKKSYTTSYDIIKDSDYYIVLLELCPCNSRDEMRLCEQKHIDSCECLNNNKSFQSEEELLEYHKQYREQNREQIAEQRKQYRQQKCNEIAEYNKKYKDLHRDEINAKSREKICCPNCQKEMSRNWLSRHKNTCPQLKKEIVTVVI